MRKTIWFILAFLVLLWHTSQELGLQAAYGIVNGPAGVVDQHSAPAGSVALPSTVGDRRIHLPLIFANANTATLTPGPDPTSTFTLGPTYTASPTPTLTPTFTPTPTCTPTPTFVPLTIGHMTDAHIGGSKEYSVRLPGVVRAISRRAQVLVDTGDCTDHGTIAEAMEFNLLVNSNVSVQWKAVAGNHDSPSVFQQYIGPLKWTWDIDGYRLIGIYTENIDYTALRQALTLDKPCIVFGHYPLSHCEEADQIELRKLFRDYNVPIYIAGHTHLDYLERDPESGTWLLTGQRAGMGHYRLITLQGFQVARIDWESTH